MPLTKVTGGEIDNNSTINVSSYSVTGVATFSSGPILIGSGTSTGTATQRLQVTGGAYVSGNLGIGTTNPTTKLDVFVNGGEGLPSVVTGERMRVISNDIVGRSGYLSIISGSSAYSGVFFGDKDSADVGKIRYYHADNSLQFHVNGLSNPSIHLDSSGNLLVGTSTPTGTASQPLQVSGGAYVSGNVGVGTTLPSSGTLEIAKQQNFIWNGLSLKNTGTSGITLGSLMQLHAYNGSSIAALGGVLVSGSTWNYGTYLPNQFSIVSTGSGGVAIAASIAPIIFRNGNADVDNSPERARVSAGGTFHVGTTNQWPGSTSNTIAIFNGTILCGNTSGLTTSNSGGSVDTAIFCGGDIEIARDGVSGTQRHARIRGTNDSTGGPYSGGIALDYYYYNGSAYVYNEGFRIAANGRIGIGTNINIADALEVFSPNYGGVTLKTTTSANRPTLSFLNTGASGLAYIQSINKDIIIGRANADYGGHTETARFNSTGAFVLAGGTTTANGIGIAFPATQSASTDPNTLDDYEEGTWTPQLSFGGATTGIVQSIYTSGHYTKVGRLVVVRCTIELTNKGTATGAAAVTGLPFTSSVESYGSFRIYNTITWTSGAQLTFQITGATVFIYSTASGAFIADLTNTNFANNSAFNFTMSYFV